MAGASMWRARPARARPSSSVSPAPRNPPPRRYRPPDRSGNPGDPVKSHGVSPQHALAALRIERSKQFARRRPPSLIAASELDHRPIAPPDQALGSEALEKQINEGAEIRDAPGRAGFGDEAGEFAPGVRLLRNPPHLGRPWFALADGDAGLGTMIDHQPQRRMTLEKLAHIREVSRLHERIEPEIDVDERAEDRLELGIQHPVGVRDVLHHRADAAQERISGEALEPLGRVRRLEIDPADHALDETAALLR